MTPGNRRVRRAIVLLVVLFSLKGLALTIQWGNEPAVQKTSETIFLEAAHGYATAGFLKNAGLPTIPGIEHITPIQKLQDSHVYTHFLPGDAYLGGLVFKATGIDGLGIQIARVLPFLHTLLAVLLLGWVARTRLFPQWSWGQA